MDKSKRNLIIFIAFAMIVPAFGTYIYQIFTAKNILVGKEDRVLIIPTGTTWNDLYPVLKEQNYVSNIMYFGVVAKALKYQENIKAGRYILRKDMSNWEAVRLLRSGGQAPVKVTFNNVRIKEELAGKITRNLELDSADFLQVLNDPKKVTEYGFDTATIATMFLPDTYEMYWTTSADGVLKKMKKEYDKFWTEERLKKAKEISLTPLQVSVLASIVESETIKRDEASTVAGAYINRLNINMPLQADPTIKFALRDFAKKRILLADLEIDSPYNTYKYTGLPPSIIRLPPKTAIDAVLNYKKHNFIYFCAREDFSGYHNFESDFEKHKQNARRYQRALNARNIYK